VGHRPQAVETGDPFALPNSQKRPAQLTKTLRPTDNNASGDVRLCTQSRLPSQVCRHILSLCAARCTVGPRSTRIPRLVSNGSTLCWRGVQPSTNAAAMCACCCCCCSPLGSCSQRCRRRRTPEVCCSTAAGGDHGMDHHQNWLRFPYDSTFLRSHYLHPHPYPSCRQPDSVFRASCPHVKIT
jgi:hypothetical protein